MQTGASLQIEEMRKLKDRITFVECHSLDAPEAAVAEDGSAREIPKFVPEDDA